MPGTGLAAPNRVALGENSRMLIGGAPGIDMLPQLLTGLIAPFTDLIFLRFVTGTVDVGGNVLDVTDNLSFGFTENSRGPKSSTMNADCFWRSADNPFAFPPQLVELEETPRVIIWPDIINTVNAYVKYPVGFCEGFTITASGVAECRFSLRLKSQRRYYHTSRPDPAGVFG